MSKNYLSCFGSKKVGDFEPFWTCRFNYLIMHLIFTLDKNICPICQGKMVNKTKGYCCSHTFCFKCILTWVQKKNVCPICKRTIMRLEKCNNI